MTACVNRLRRPSIVRLKPDQDGKIADGFTRTVPGPRQSSRSSPWPWMILAATSSTNGWIERRGAIERSCRWPTFSQVAVCSIRFIVQRCKSALVEPAQVLPCRSITKLRTGGDHSTPSIRPSSFQCAMPSASLPSNAAQEPARCRSNSDVS